MKAKIQIPSPVLFQEVEIEGTPDEIAAFVKALGKEMPAPLPWGRVAMIPTVWNQTEVCPVDGGVHRYPAVWMSVSPPACEKCQMQMQTAPTHTTTYYQMSPSESTNQGEAQFFWRGEGP